AQKKLNEEKIPIGSHRARQMTAGDYDKFDYLIGMDDDNIKRMLEIAGGDPKGKIFKMMSFAGETRSIADPWFTGNFDETYNDLTVSLDGLLKKLGII
ncbi:MAG: low molecular weight phosphotyrosine protein phosphatase, partial [Clostridiales bacterium]|nr:low molecular weight phosphotyrosine protein phosphatase [Clostridiales bacterium]